MLGNKHKLWLHGRSRSSHDWHHLLSRHRPWHHLTHARATWTGPSELVLEIHVRAGISAAGLRPTLLTGSSYSCLVLGEEALRLRHCRDVVSSLLRESHLKIK